MKRHIIFIFIFIILASLITSGIMIVVDQFINYQFFRWDWMIIIVLSITITVFSFGRWYIRGEDKN